MGTQKQDNAFIIYLKVYRVFSFFKKYY